MAQRTCDEEGRSRMRVAKARGLLARTQVYLSKTKLRKCSEYLAVYILKVQ